MNKQELIAKIAKDTAGTKASAGKALASMIEGITKTLKKGGSVSLVGFGTFSTSQFISLLIVPLSIVMLFWLSRRDRGAVATPVTTGRSRPVKA